MMTRIDGLEVCRQAREAGAMPILMVSAKTEDMDKILGLMTGADDYLAKSFNPLELVVRVKTLLRRAYQLSVQPPSTQEGILRLNELTISRETHTAGEPG